MAYSANNILAHNHRQAQRYPIRFPAALFVNRKRIDVEVRDISSRGALLYLANPPVAGSEVIFSGVSFEVVATVAWRNDAACGLNFHRAVDPLDIVRKNVPEMARFRLTGTDRARIALQPKPAPSLAI